MVALQEIKDTTLLLTSYKRPQNVAQIITHFKGFMPIHVVNNNPNVKIVECDGIEKVYNNEINKWCIDRWHKAINVKTPYVVILDDDILPSYDTILKLRHKIEILKISMAGIYGKNFSKELKFYTELESHWCDDREVDLLIGSCILLSLEKFSEVYENYIIPWGTQDRGDDLQVSLALLDHFGKKHLVVSGEVECLPDPFALNKDKAHFSKRQLVIERFFQRFAKNHLKGKFSEFYFGHDT